MNPISVREKFGGDYIADERTFVMGIHRCFTEHFAERFEGLNVLETCTGGGFTTISLAGTAKHVYTVEIDLSHQEQALSNVRKSGLLDRVSFVHGSILAQGVLDALPSVDAAFIDPDWAVTGPDHVYRFMNSTTEPPSDILLRKVLEITDNVAIVQPPAINPREFSDLPDHECERLYLDESHELFCLYFGILARSSCETEFRAPQGAEGGC